jgi:hypothetical protein
MDGNWYYVFHIRCYSPLMKDLTAALKELSRAVAATTGKPESYVIVHILPDQVNLFCLPATALQILVGNLIFFTQICYLFHIFEIIIVVPDPPRTALILFELISRNFFI